MRELRVTVAGKQMGIKLEDWTNGTILEGYAGLIHALSLGNAAFSLNLAIYMQAASIFAFQLYPIWKQFCM